MLPLDKRASVSHEISHVLLDTRPDLAIVPAATTMGPSHGAGSNLLAALLLVPRDAAAEIAKSGKRCKKPPRHSGSLTSYMEWRLNETGADPGKCRARR